MTQVHPRDDRRAAYDAFLQTYPEYAETSVLDDLRTKEFSRLDDLDQVYLDYTGAGLYAASQIQRHGAMLTSGVFGNPHSANPPSTASTELIESCRRRVLRFFNAPPDLYCVVFTGNASQALKLVGEAYPFESGDQFLLTFDNHNSVNGIREFDRAHGAQTRYIPVFPPDLVTDDSTVERHLQSRVTGTHNLFAFPAQSNFSGVQHPLEWVALAQGLGWDVLVDAAAFVPTNRLDLSICQPDYVALSFYKMFGYPTGVGALIARKDALNKLRRPWFSGGTISVASVQGDDHYMSIGSEAFEDGTVNYLDIPAVEFGLDLMESIGVSVIHERVRCLSGWLISELLAIRHPNGRQLVRLYGPVTTRRRGGTLAFNFCDAAGAVIDHQKVEGQAGRQGIALRTGCFCNPGAGEVALGLSEDELTRCFSGSEERMDRDDLIRCIDADAGGAVRVSVGLASNFSDVYRFITFARGFL
jgi:selenocysteine lyase/cysteine desulfurase